MYNKNLFKEKSMPVGSPHLRLLLTGMLQEVLLLGQRGATRDKSPGTEV